MLDKSGFAGIGACLAVLEDYECPFGHKPAAEYQVGDFVKSRMVIRRVGEYYVGGSTCVFQKFEYVAAHHPELFIAEQSADMLYKSCLDRSLFDSRHFSGSPREKFKGYSPCAGEEVYNAAALNVAEILYDVEDIFAREVGGGTCSDVARHIKAASAIFASNYSH